MKEALNISWAQLCSGHAILFSLLMITLSWAGWGGEGMAGRERERRRENKTENTGVREKE